MDMRGPPMGEPRNMMGDPRGPMMMEPRGPPMEARGSTTIKRCTLKTCASLVCLDKLFFRNVVWNWLSFYRTNTDQMSVFLASVL